MPDQQPRTIPGLPPSEPSTPGLSKSQKKRLKAKAGGSQGSASPALTPTAIPDTTSAALVDHAPEPAAVKNGLVALILVAEPSAAPSESGRPKSAVWDLVNKRQKALGKKITRIEGYGTSTEPLNEDQKRSMATLPALAAVRQELEEVKKAIEVHDAEQAAELAAAKALLLVEAIAQAEAAATAKVVELLALLRLRALLAEGQGADLDLGHSDEEGAAIAGIADLLLAQEDAEQHRLAALGFLRSEGEHGGVPFTRLSELARTHIDTRAAAGPTASSGGAPADSQGNLDGSYTFVNPTEPESTQPTSEEPVAVIETIQITDDGVVVDTAEVITDSQAGPIDWADDDLGGLPSITGLAAEFGTPEAATPVETAPEEAPYTELPQEQEDPLDDGFTQARGGRGGRGRGGGYPRGGRGEFRGGYRGRGGGFRGGDRGGERGGERGGFRGGDRGNFRGGERGGERGGFRGGDRGAFRGGEGGGYRGGGDRGGFSPRGSEFPRGGDRGGFRGGDRGGDRGAYRGSRSDGEWRNAGRGRGRGGPPAADAPTATA